MTDVELQALTALVNAQTAALNADVTKYGEQLFATDHTWIAALEAELRARRVLPGNEEPK